MVSGNGRRGLEVARVEGLSRRGFVPGRTRRAELYSVSMTLSHSGPSAHGTFPASFPPKYEGSVFPQAYQKPAFHVC